MLAELIMKVYRELYGEGGGMVRTGSPDLYSIPETHNNHRRVGGRGQPVHVNIRKGAHTGPN